MRPLRLLLSLCSTIVAITLLLYVAFGSQRQHALQNPAATQKKGKLNAFFSFTSPSSLFPPSAIISLTDDNSTFFLARPAAFGPLLPSKGLSGPLWIGAGFGEDTMGNGELGCSDVPGWSDGGDHILPGSKAALDPKRKTVEAPSGAEKDPESPKAKRSQVGADVKNSKQTADDDGTDDFLHHPLPASNMPKPHGKASEHADIQSLQEGAEIAGKVVLLKRGGCGFLEKTKWAQRRGGVALIVGDDVRGGPLIRMYAHGDTSNITIPALFTSHTTAHLLSSLLPSGGLLQDLSPEDAAKLGISKTGKASKFSKTKDTSANKYGSTKSTSTKAAATPLQTPPVKGASKSTDTKQSDNGFEEAGWFSSLLWALGLGDPDQISSGENRRPPSSGNIDWVLVEDWDDDRSEQKPLKTKPATKSTNAKPTPTRAPDDFVIGEQDWRDPDLLPQQTTSQDSQPSPKSKPIPAPSMKGGNVLPGSGVYKANSHSVDAKQQSDGAQEGNKGWFSSLLGDDEEEDASRSFKRAYGSAAEASRKKAVSNAHSKDKEGRPDAPEQHEGLWVTLTPTSMSSSPFFDTLLVLVVSPLVTLTVVYALLLLRSRIRRRRWRAPKSVVERLPVRTYHTISDTASSPSATPGSSSPTTPLLQHTPSRPASSLSRPRSRTTSEVPATSSSFQQGGSRTPEEEKRDAGLAEWRRRYGGRQKECVVCLEEYVDGVSRVMSLPCGHEFHADCITPWLVTRRRTCPICKGDVVRSLSQSYRNRGPHSPSPTRASRRPAEDSDYLQVQAAETRNDSPSASRPVPRGPALVEEYDEDFDADVEANWADPGPEDEDEDDERARNIPGGRDRDRTLDLSGSVRELSSTVTTTIWRGFDAIRGAAGLQRRGSQEEVDRDR